MLRKVGQGLALLALLFVELPVIVLAFLTVLLSFGLGAVPLFPPMVRLVRRLTGLTRRLAGEWCGVEIPAPYRPMPPRAVPMADGWYRSDRTLYKTPRIPEWNARWKWLFGDPATWRDLLWLFLDPLVKPVILVLLAPYALRVYGRWCALLLAPTASVRLAGQVRRLTQVRSDTIDSQAAEMRRIERDLHDGAQARLVALGMTLGAVEQLIEDNPAAAKALVGKAREVSADALTELRRVVRGIHPPVLAERGLGDAVRAMALDSPLRVSVEVDLPHRPESPVEAAVYFSVSELLSNAARHGGAEQATVDISGNGKDLTIVVTDDGMGGADPSKGSGLHGIERRLAAFDGLIALSSPPGGPTTVSMFIPGVLPDARGGVLRRMPLWKSSIVVFCWGLAWLPLFPQGIVTAVFKALDLSERSWFYALYLPEAWQWPAIIGNIILGMAMYGIAMYLPIQHSRERWMAEAGPTRLWLTRC
ncbi:histidine kinase [Nonomuraea sp. NPDC050556]|uniref:sensor histidine kinase n=1 Tax=Nonomuraea sp. NPDC050556 TaxID=3364369 RepID=UPI00378FDC6A